MFTLQRWWDRNSLKVGLVALAIATAWVIRQTNGSAVYELYRLITLPMQSVSTSAPDALTNARIVELQERVIELESQNQSLREFVEGANAPERANAEAVLAPIIGRSADHWWQLLLLGRGTEDGIQRGDVVTAPGGLVGRIISVTPNTSQVLLISDPSSRVGITISRSRNMGYMRGQSANRAVIKFFDKVPDVRRGDVVSTSSLSQLFPEGIPIGRIESVNFNKSPAPEAIIELTAPINSLEWVRVEPNPKAAFLDSLNLDADAAVPPAAAPRESDREDR